MNPEAVSSAQYNLPSISGSVEDAGKKARSMLVAMDRGWEVHKCINHALLWSQYLLECRLMILLVAGHWEVISGGTQVLHLRQIGDLRSYHDNR